MINGELARDEKVVLRYPVPADREAFVRLRRDSRAHLECWEPIPPKGFDAFGDDAFDRELESHCTEIERRWLIVRASDGALAGRLALGAIERGPLQSGRFGYWLGQAFTGQGLMTSALRLGLSLAFGEQEPGLGLHRVSANIIPRNGASRDTLVRAGFSKEGLSPRYLKIQGMWEDHERWAITREDWEQGKCSPEPR